LQWLPNDQSTAQLAAVVPATFKSVRSEHQTTISIFLLLECALSLVVASAVLAISSKVLISKLKCNLLQQHQSDLPQFVRQYLFARTAAGLGE
jgi:hypothetical protein